MNNLLKISLFLSFVFTPPLTAQVTTVEDFVLAEPELRNFSLELVLQRRCLRFLPLSEGTTCAQAVTTLIDILDYDLIPLEKVDNKPSFLFIAFKSELTSLLSLESTTELLNFLNQSLYQTALNPLQGKNLWEEVSQFTGQNKTLSSGLMASFFQDTSYGQLHLEYLRREDTVRSTTFLKNLDLLRQCIDHISSISETSPEAFKILFFPKNFNQEGNNSIYHFYVPSYLAQKLQDAGYSPHISRVVPMLLTLTYEFFTIKDGMNYLFSEPLSLATSTYSWKIRDIYSGYAGGAFGIQKNPNFSLQYIAEGFSQSTYTAMDQLLKELK
jgi:hypothetical protein